MISTTVDSFSACSAFSYPLDQILHKPQRERS
ncbi:Protein of unknown function [Pyronema omphalodes CBS 100304]|uniref:Uncharacterized protein n=1 Tax=Pyronema omphalodes (strain CBS 100304) TaxID=1076935 RepID=U4LL44_PYROM|nr:Protein of unknown function [Pyronema omphalodes CBS 100304]